MADGGVVAVAAIIYIFWAIEIGVLLFLVYRSCKRRKQERYSEGTGDDEAHSLQIKDEPFIKSPPLSSPVNGYEGAKSSVTDEQPKKPTTPDVVRQVHKPQLAPKPPDSAEPGEYYNLGENTAVPIAQLPDLVRQQKKADHPFKDQFDKLVPDKDKAIPWDYAAQEALKPQNRFKNIIPYDHTRVTLSVLDNNPHSDYINASFIDGFSKKREYIACHGPVERTMAGVWRMVWEYNVPCIVMVTNFTEMSTMKMNCEQYWPNTGQKSYGAVSVSMTGSQCYPDYTVRQLSIKHATEEGTREVVHYHYTAWPDHGVPSNISTLLKIRRLTKQPHNSKRPVVVHCRAGIGRTGTFIAMDYLLEECEAKKQVDVFSCVNKMRRQRVNMVQTLVQYAFLYDIMAEYVMFGSTTSSNSDFPAYYSKLVAGNPSLLDRAFKSLEAAKPVFSSVDLEEARADANKDKNRDLKVLPSSRHRVFFTALEDGANPYFNAVAVKGYRSEFEFFVTQVPLPTTVDLFWRLMLEKYRNLKSIVCLQNSTDQLQWFPTSTNDPLMLPGLIVRVTGKAIKNNVEIYDLVVSTTEEAQTEYANVGAMPGSGNAEAEVSKQVRLFYAPGWADKPLSQRSTQMLVNVRDEVRRWQGSLQDEDVSTFVVCRNGAQESGLYIAFNYLMDMSHCEHEIDVTQIVKQIRTTRPQFISSKEQYHFLHTMMLNVLKSAGGNDVTTTVSGGRAPPVADDNATYSNI